MPNQIDLPACTQMWTEQDRDLFNKLPVWMVKQQVEKIKWYGKWAKMLKQVPWSANMGNLMQGVRKERSPITRAQAFPNPITQVPKRDIQEVRELSEFGKLYRHHIESNLMHFLPSFTDFLNDHVVKTNEDITEKIEVYKDLFYRTAIFHAAPYVWVCGKAGGELVAAPHWVDGDVAEKKDQGFLQAMIAACKAPLNFSQLKKLGTVMYSDLGIPPFSGSVLPDGTDGAALKQKYALMDDVEHWDYLPEDPYLKDNKYVDLDIITDSFRGSLFGRWTTSQERYSLHIKADGTFVAPETIESNPAAYNVGETIPRSDYTSGASSPYVVYFAMGAEAYKSIRVGPPPADWRNMSMKQFANLDWNGKVNMTQNVMIPCKDADNNIFYDTNKYGEYLALLSDIVLGIRAENRRYIIPIIAQRTRTTIP